eukprot:7763899-Pyramimonas_sp.AAC.1
MGGARELPPKMSRDLGHGLLSKPSPIREGDPRKVSITLPCRRFRLFGASWEALSSPRLDSPRCP